MTVTKAKTCAFPGCEVIPEAHPQHGGPAPGYCSLPEHNAHSAFQAMKRGEGGGGAGFGPGMGVHRG